jgi:hypothetical protein
MSRRDVVAGWGAKPVALQGYRLSLLEKLQ